MAIRFLGLTLALLLLGGNLSGDDKKKGGGSKDDMMAKMMSAGATVEQHKVLKGFVGKWTYTGTWNMPDGTSMPISGGAECELILDGRFVAERVWSADDGKSFQGHGVIGYDKDKKKFAGGWIDSMSTGLTTTEGTWDPKTSTMTMHFSCKDPMSGQMVHMKETAVVKPDSIVKTAYAKVGDKEVKAMELHYKRAK